MEIGNGLLLQVLTQNHIFKDYSPWLQSKKFIPNAKYIKKWLPQLKNIPANYSDEKTLYKYCDNLKFSEM